jgi:cyclopropane-fatty-acyl-phospholipid synthase
MNTTSSELANERLSGSKGRLPLSARLVISNLKPMKQGCLKMLLPNGDVLTFGSEAVKTPARIEVKDWRFFKRCLLYGDIGFGESYVDGDWDTRDITAVIGWFIRNVDSAPGMSGSNRKKWTGNLLKFANRAAHLLRRNSRENSRRNISEHYDLSNDLYRLFLDESMTYSSGMFGDGKRTLAEAQEAKYEALCRKLGLKEGMEILEIGSGWGGFAEHAARKHGCRIHGITLSQEQLEYAQERIRNAGLEDQVRFSLTDYRDVKGSYDRIVSIEMIEAVGDEYFDTYFKTCDRVLKPGGKVGLQVITCPDSRYEELRDGVDWIQKHIFPGSLLPSVTRLLQGAAKGNLMLHHMESFSQDYARTLHHWSDHFEARIDAVKKLGFDEHFVRSWRYYLQYCEAAFALNNISVVQTVMTRPNHMEKEA